MTLEIAPWLPPTGDTMKLEQAGRAWDAVRVPARIGLPVLARLGEHSGAAIHDRTGGGIYWLIRPGTADAWDLPQSSVEVRGETSYITVPPVARTAAHHSLRWAVPLTPTCYLTDPELLHAALAAEIDAVTGPRPVLLPCEPCGSDAVFGGRHACEGTTTVGLIGREIITIPAAPCPCGHASTEPDS